MQPATAYALSQGTKTCCQLQGLAAVLFLATFNKFEPLLLYIESSKAMITIKEGGWFMLSLGFTILGQKGKIFM